MPNHPTFSPETHYLVVTRKAAKESGLLHIHGENIVKQIAKRVCSAHRRSGRQVPTQPYSYAGDACPQPALTIDDGGIVWTITLSTRFDDTGKKRVAYVVGAKPYSAFEI